MKLPSTNSRWILYALALGATVLAGSFAGGQDDPAPSRPARQVATVESRPGSPAREPAAGVPAIALETLGARTTRKSDRDLFPSTSWDQLARSAIAVKAPPPPPPQAPPLPFSYMGRMVEDGRTTVFLVSGGRNVIARQGDTLQGQYRVEEIGDSEVALTYLPLNQRQTLATITAPGPSAPRAPAPASPEAPQAPDTAPEPQGDQK